MNLPGHAPALLVEVGAVFVLVAALVSRVLLSRAGIPSIVTLLAFGLLSGPTAFDFMRLNLNEPATRALLQLAVVIVLFEATLRIDLGRIPKLTIALMGIIGTALVLWIIPGVARAYHFSELIASMIAAISIVTGPTVIGPLMMRLRPRTSVSHLLESEGLALDALGVIVAAAVFATYTSRPGGPADAAIHIVQRVGAGVVLGLVWGLIGRGMLTLTSRTSSDVSKLGVLFIGFGAYASADWLAHESGLVAVVICGLMLDVRPLPHERLLRAFKEDLSMLALSTVFVLLASQIQLQKLGPLVAPAAAITGCLIGIRFIAVALSTIRSGITLSERLLVACVFPRGIVAVSLATYYATQIPAWGLHGGNQLLGVLFLIVIFTIALSTPAAIAVTEMLHLKMPSVVLAGVSPLVLEVARRYRDSGHRPFIVDTDEHAVAFARSHDLEAAAIDRPDDISSIVLERRASMLILDDSDAWRDNLTSLPKSVQVVPAASAFSHNH